MIRAAYAALSTIAQAVTDGQSNEKNDAETLTEIADRITKIIVPVCAGASLDHGTAPSHLYHFIPMGLRLILHRLNGLRNPQPPRRARSPRPGPARPDLPLPPPPLPPFLHPPPHNCIHLPRRPLDHSRLMHPLPPPPLPLPRDPTPTATNTAHRRRDPDEVPAPLILQVPTLGRDGVRAEGRVRGAGAARPRRRPRDAGGEAVEVRAPVRDHGVRVGCEAGGCEFAPFSLVLFFSYLIFCFTSTKPTCRFSSHPSSS